MEYKLNNMENNIYYSQFQEDKILNKFFPRQNGTCIEIGGFDGITGSTTYFFEKRGWKCLVVEPIPQLYNKILTNRKCIVVNCAASNIAEKRDFFIAEGVEMLSSLTPDENRIINEKGSLSKIVVQCMTLDSILEQHKIDKIDFMTIDVEGHELEVLNGFSLARFQPEILIIEDGTFGSNPAVKNYLMAQGLVRFKITGCNEWYTNKLNNRIYNDIDVIKTNLIVLYNKSIRSFKSYIKKIIIKLRNKSV